MVYCLMIFSCPIQWQTIKEPKHQRMLRLRFNTAVKSALLLHPFFDFLGRVIRGFFGFACNQVHLSLYFEFGAIHCLPNASLTAPLAFRVLVFARSRMRSSSSLRFWAIGFLLSMAIPPFRGPGFVHSG